MGVTVDLLQNLRLKARLPGDNLSSLSQPCIGPRPYRVQKGVEEPLAVSLARDENKAFHHVYIDEGLARSSYLKVRALIVTIQTHEENLRKCTLPAKLTTLHNQVTAEESKCMKLAKKTNELITHLQEHPEELPTFSNLRRRLADLLTEELADVQKAMVNARVQRQQEFHARTMRMLVYAFPEVEDYQVEEVMQHPELANDIVQYRLTYGDGLSFSKIHAKVSSSTAGMQRRLESEALNLEIMFFKFSDLVSKNDGVISQIEENIQSTLQHTEAAIVNLKEANELKKGNQQRACMMKLITWGVILFIVWYFFGNQIEAMCGLATPGATAPESKHVSADQMALQPGDKGVKPFLTLVDQNAAKEDNEPKMKAMQAETQPAKAKTHEEAAPATAQLELWATADEDNWRSQAAVAAASAARARAEAAAKAQAAANAQADAARADAEAARAEAVANQKSTAKLQLLSSGRVASTLTGRQKSLAAGEAQDWPFKRQRGRHQAAIESLRASMRSGSARTFADDKSVPEESAARQGVYDKPLSARVAEDASAGHHSSRNAILAVFVERMESGA